MSILLETNELSTKARKQIEDVLHAKLGDSFVKVEFEDIQSTDEQLTITLKITLRVTSARGRPEDEIPSFFGLTRSVRSAMDNLGRSVFPVFEPVLEAV